MKSNFEIVAEITPLAKKYYGEMDLAFLWGCSQALLSSKDLEIILGMLKEKENA